MFPSGKILLDLTAADLLRGELVTLLPCESLRSAAHKLTRAGVGGAPVVDEAGRCVGVLSTADLARRLGENAALADVPSTDVVSPWQLWDTDTLPPPNEVRSCMSPDLVVAWPDTRLGELARQMLRHHVHRVVVMDAGERPLGVVTTSDILAAIVAWAGHQRPVGSLGSVRVLRPQGSGQPEPDGKIPAARGGLPVPPCRDPTEVGVRQRVEP